VEARLRHLGVRVEHVSAGRAVGFHVGVQSHQPAELEYGFLRRAGVHRGRRGRADVFLRGEEGEEGGRHSG